MITPIIAYFFILILPVFIFETQLSMIDFFNLYKKHLNTLIYNPYTDFQLLLKN